MIDILELNEQVYQYLHQTTLTYTFRKSNYASRLTQGYWFYGTESYLAISFWSGMDWKNRTPNIIFVISQYGNVFLEFNVSDSDRKREFVTTYLQEALDLGTDGRRFRKWYADNSTIVEAMGLFEQFISTDKNLIDRIIDDQAKNFFLTNEDAFGRIDKKEFRGRQQNVLKYREVLEEQQDAEIRSSGEKPVRIHSFKVWDSGPIAFAELLDIPHDNQWIFITGENGSGKTSFLRAIGTTLGYRALEKNEQKRNRDFHVETELFSEYDDHPQSFNRYLNDGTKNRRPKVAGLCMYGPLRLYNSRKLSESKFKSLYTKSGSFGSLFEDNAPLLDIDKQLDIWKKDRKSLHLLEKRQYHIKNILTAVVPSLYNVDMFLNEIGKPVEYQTRKNDNANQHTTPWENLSSGTKSVFSLIVDILLRLYDQQPKISDPSELKGIVLIDEIDLHLHPPGSKRIGGKPFECF
jgi:hypothetical protein